VNYAPNRV